MSRENENDSTTLILVSKDSDIPDLKITKGNTIEIGRNPITKIKDLKCPRKLYRIELRAQETDWFVSLTNLKTNEIVKLKEGEILEGPGFKYQIKFDKTPTVSETEDKSVDKGCIRKSCEDEGDPVNQQSTKKTKLESSDEKESAVDKEIMEDKTETSQWEEVDDGSVQIYHYLGGGKPSAKIASFDFDGTLVSVKSGAKFARDGSDWKLWDKSLPGLIKKYTDGGHRFVIFSNQKGVSTGHMSFDNVKQRIESCVAAIGIPCIAFLACQDNIYRKPRPGMWYLLQNCHNNFIDIDLEESFFVGDAAGRKSALNKDHSCADILFAINNEIGFLTPEQLRVGMKPKKSSVISRTTHILPSFDPRALRDSKTLPFIELDANGKETSKLTSLTEVLEKIKALTSNGSHCIIFVGLPGSGKSTFFSELLSKEGYFRINRDELGTKEKCEREFEKHVKANSDQTIKLAVDNLNTDVTSRSSWLKLCKTHNLIPIAFQFNTSREHAIHNNTYRRLLNQMCASSSSPAVPDWLISNHSKNLAPPTIKEGFSTIFKLNFQPLFGEREDKEIGLYYMYLNDK